MTEAIRKLYPEEPIYTFWDYLGNPYSRNAGLRLDHFLINEKLVNRLINANVDKYFPGWVHSSDHAPDWIVLSDE